MRKPKTSQQLGCEMSDLVLKVKLDGKLHRVFNLGSIWEVEEHTKRYLDEYRAWDKVEIIIVQKYEREGK